MLSHTNLKIQSPRLRGEAITTRLRTLLSSYSGVVIDDWLGGNWSLFFILTALMVLPSLIFLYQIRHRLYALENSYHGNK